MSPLARQHWIFDLDGTLTVAVHDFDAIRRALELPEGRPILEALAALPPAAAERARSRLDEIELELARQARMAEGADALLALLVERGARVGILTRNCLPNVHETLRVTGLARFFANDVLLGRDEAPHKPHPEGIERLLAGWGAGPGDAVMVGDYLWDLLAGRAAGAATIYVDARGEFPFSLHADLRYRGLDPLLRELRSRADS